ncbi:hypothetical protein [Loktanella sp. Alg231-35]|uniref:hypothetical protein n=1 Tax=Loktanella sp. Alg231-35 TaxID=1922220 RepID=UPI000D552E4A|nr:hypothetical protein [Loktanella sp. Alg231-35]
MAGRDDAYEAFTLHWSEFSILVEYQWQWLNSGNWHIQLRCDEPLPVTQTGYRSIFVADAELDGETDIRAFVVTALDEAAQSKAWQMHMVERRQLSLF